MNVRLGDEKRRLRDEARSRRRATPDLAASSRDVLDRLEALPEFAAARHLLCYVGKQDEVRTAERIAAWLRAGKRVAVPWCRGTELEACWLTDVADLQPGRFGVPEPPEALRQRSDRVVDLAELELFAVPGLAFDRQGHRLGYGAGFFDRFLVRRNPSAVLVGLCLDATLFDAVPVDAWDVPMDVVLTESQTIRAR